MWRPVSGSSMASDIETWPSFRDIPEPRMLCFGIGNGSGTKLFQGYFDDHPQILMCPGYVLMYLYPHWEQWRVEIADNWTWEAIVENFCIKHASLIDSRNLPGHDGLTSLGKNQDQHVSIDGVKFRTFLEHILKGRPISSRTFVLAVHYAHAFAKGEDLFAKKVLFYHIHVHEYVHYLINDFPDMLTIASVRDPRSNIKGRFLSNVKIDERALNQTDAAIYLRQTFINHWRFHIDSMERLKYLDPQRVRIFRHEDMHNHLQELLHAAAAFMGIEVHPSMSNLTSGGLEWWGDSHHQMKPMNKPNPGIVSQGWQEELSKVDWFVLEGLGFNYCSKYGYTLYYYKKDGLQNRIKLFCALFLPFGYERWILRRYLSPQYFYDFLKASISEAMGKVALKDYEFSAVYRHKWYRQGLNLHIPTWYRRLLLYARNGSASSNPPGTFPVFDNLVIGLYVGVNVIRYFYALAVFPLIVFKRSMISIPPFLKMIRRTDVLPPPLV